jgi:tetratricopeptide (TPR) repeat protein
MVESNPKYQPHFHGPVQGVVIGDNNTVTIIYQTGERLTIPFLAPPAPANFVDNINLLSRLKQLLLASGNKPVVVLLQIPGVGKTAVAEVLANDKEVIKHFSDGVLWAGLGREPDVFALLGQWAIALGIPANELAHLKKVEERAMAIHNKIGLRRILLVIDDAWQAEKTLAFQVGGSNCGLIITTRLLDVAAQFTGEGIQVVHELSEEDGLALLAKLAPEAVKAEPVEARKLVREVGALPQALILIGKHLWKESFGGQTRRIHTALTSLRKAQERLKLEQPQSPLEHHPSLPPATPLSLTASIRISDEALDKESRRVLRALSVFRPKPNFFSEDAALAVTGSTVDTLDKLVDAGLLEFERERYMLPRTIADYAASDLPPEDAVEYHRRAITYYSQWLREYEESRRDITPYQRMYSYEDPEWQTVKSSWLYHLAHTPDRITANLAFTKAYLDAFWWWGCYRSFPFCERLLDEWRETQTSQEAQEWLRFWCQFHESYPTGYEKRGQGNWQAVEKAMLEIRKSGGIDGEISQLDAERRHLRAMTDLFLAESHRYRQVNDPEADKYYHEALDLFKEAGTEDDDWNIPWVLWHLGELYLERGQGEKVPPLCLESTKLAMAATDDKHEWDNEVISNNCRLQADVFWQQGDLKLAFRNYARAVFYAYVFHGCPNPPDFYTLDFYREMLHRTLERLYTLWREGQKTEALQACQYLRDFWNPYWKSVEKVPTFRSVEVLLSENRQEELATYLFPPPPTGEEIACQAPKYVEQVLKMLEEFASVIEADV